VIRAVGTDLVDVTRLEGYMDRVPGLRERMRLLGGRLSLVREAGIFTLRAELPMEEKTAEEKEEEELIRG